jgi:hypothetical protein
MKLNTLQRIGRMHWLRGRDRILRAFSNPDRQQPVLFDWTVFYYGAFSVNELQLLAALAAGLRARGKPVNFYDVGANVGHHSLFMSRHAEHIFAFEPFAKVRSEMERKFNHAGGPQCNRLSGRSGQPRRGCRLSSAYGLKPRHWNPWRDTAG